MEVSTIHAVTKLAADDYELWGIRLPRTRVYDIRQNRHIIDGDMKRVLGEIPSAQHQSNSVLNFLLPHSEGIKLIPVDMGEDFREKNRYNGNPVRGTKEEIMEAFQKELKAQGYLRPRAAFVNVDIIETMQKIMEHNTDYYQTDFQYDKEALQEAAEDRNGIRQFLWMTRDSGTWNFPERSVYIEKNNAYNTWMYYGGTRNDRVKAFWVEIQGRNKDEGKIYGDILEVDYQKHLDYLCTHSFAPTGVEIAFKNPNDLRVFSYQEYDQNWQSIAQRYGTVDRKQFLVEDNQALAHAVINARNLFWEGTQEMSVDDYVKRMDHDRLHDYGYTADDLVLTGPLDAEVAMKHGLECYVLGADGAKEPADHEMMRECRYSGSLFGMSAEEKATMQYFKQDCIPLFSPAELRQICSLAVQAGMENDPAKAPLLDSIIHKAECAMPRGEMEHTLEQGHEMDMEDRE